MQLNISESETKKLYHAAGQKLAYAKQIFTYDEEITVNQHKKGRINHSLDRLGVQFSPTDFQVNLIKFLEWTCIVTNLSCRIY